MDDIKDIQRADNLSKFIDGHTLKTNAFGGNRAAERLYGRCERIVVGIYLLTRHMPTHEPLREKIRSAGLDLFDAGLDMRDDMRSGESEAVVTFTHCIRSLVSLTRTLTAAGYLSIHNGEILVAAIDELGTFVAASQRSSFSENITLTKEDFIGQLTPLMSIGHSQGVKDTRERPFAKETVTDISGKGHAPSTARSQAILQVLISGREMAIKDICATLPEYSEKMVQRELALLVREGRISKSGSKRWSRYALVPGKPAAAQRT